MKLISEYKHPQNWRFAIEDEGDDVFCVYIYEYPELFDEDMQGGEYGCIRHQMNYPQDTIEMAKRFSYRHHGVPLDSWVEVKK